MKTYTCFLLTLLLLCAGARPANAQAPWRHSYYSPSSEVVSGLQHIRSGGYLLNGSRQRYWFSLVRTTDQGDTIWTRRVRVRQFASLLDVNDLLREDDQGQVLLVGLGYTNTRVLQGTCLLKLDEATGDTLWTKVLAGPNAPRFFDLAWTPAHDYALTATIKGRPYLVRMSADGQITQQTSVDYAPDQPGTVTRLARGTGGYWVAVSSATADEQGFIKMIFVSDAGVRGAEYLTSVSASSATRYPGNGIKSFIPVEEGNFLVVANSMATKLSPTFTTLWSKNDFRIFSNSPFNRALLQSIHTPDGSYAFLFIGGSGSHYVQLYLVWSAPDGTLLREKFCFSGLDTGSLDAGLMHINPVTGQFVVTTSMMKSYYEMIGFRDEGVLAAAHPFATPLAQLFPNPVADAERLTIMAPTPLTGLYRLTDMQGRTMRSGRMQPTTPGRYQVSVQGLAAGMYQLQLTNSQGHRTTLKVVKQ